MYFTTIFQKCNIYYSLTNQASLTRGLLQTMEFLKIVSSCHLLKAPMYGPCAKLQLPSLTFHNNCLRYAPQSVLDI